MKNFVEELRWRGLIHDMTPGTEEQLQKEMTTGYVGFDPTADSLHIGNLIPITLLTHFQRCGHKPMVLVGGATGRVGDPSGKTEERQLLSVEQIEHNLLSQQKQLERFLNFTEGNNRAEVVNNYDWFRDLGFLDFIRDVGKHITINYMMAKDSVKNRLETGMSFTEFSYQLIQGYDFYHLKQHRGVKLQMGGSDQWGNITTGTELIRRMGAGEAFALTAPLVKKADGSKFGKSEGGNVWLDREKTSPYKFYQFWLNSSDDDVSNYIRLFSLKSREEIESLEKTHAEAPHLRTLQKALAEEMTTRVHSAEDLAAAQEASEILFGKATSDALLRLSESDFLSVFDGVPQQTVERSVMENGVEIVELLSDHSGFLASRGEARRALKENSISVNKEKVVEGAIIGTENLINNKYVLLQRGKRNYFLVVMV
ncbi:MAG: tyrosine--tRNA ligase [Cryomorphaceae bacterium]|nr:MAG: tyrosine--tRNA ligase [Cryomorphaceae bacterium]